MIPQLFYTIIIKKVLQKMTYYAILILDYSKEGENNDRFNFNNNANCKFI